jgi:hypothetical protein
VTAACEKREKLGDGGGGWIGEYVCVEGGVNGAGGEEGYIERDIYRGEAWEYV